MLTHVQLTQNSVYETCYAAMMLKPGEHCRNKELEIPLWIIKGDKLTISLRKTSNDEISVTKREL